MNSNVIASIPTLHYSTETLWHCCADRLCRTRRQTTLLCGCLIPDWEEAAQHAPVLVASLSNQEDRAPRCSVVAKSLSREDGTQRLHAVECPIGKAAHQGFVWLPDSPIRKSARLSVVDLPFFFATICAI